MKNSKNKKPFCEKFLDYEIVNTWNSDGYVLVKRGDKAEGYECNLGNFSTADDAKRYAVLYFMVARPKDFATHVVHYITGCGTTHEWYKLKSVLEREKIKMPKEITSVDAYSCLIAYNGEIMYNKKKRDDDFNAEAFQLKVELERYKGVTKALDVMRKKVDFAKLPMNLVSAINDVTILNK